MDVWIDAAQIGPTYIPGHAHADNLTFSLHLDGDPVIVDTAISTYEKTPRRAMERATANHNTITIRDGNSSDVWGGFRVGKRATTTIERDARHRLTASHDGYGTTCRRGYQLDGNQLLIEDDVGRGAPGIARLHFAHDRPVTLRPDNCRVGNLLIEWSAADAELTDYQRAVGWNELRPGKCLRLTFTGRLRTTLSPLEPGGPRAFTPKRIRT